MAVGRQTNTTDTEKAKKKKAPKPGSKKYTEEKKQEKKSFPDRTNETGRRLAATSKVEKPKRRDIEAETLEIKKGEAKHLKAFTYDLPGGLGTLTWTEGKNYTKNGWMSENIHLNEAQSLRFFNQHFDETGLTEAQIQTLIDNIKELSIHAIIAVKQSDDNTIRINPHITVRNRARQEARDIRQATGIKDLIADERDSDFSVQRGFNSERPKPGMALIIGLENIFDDSVLLGIYKAAEAAVKDGFEVELGTKTKYFEKHDK